MICPVCHDDVAPVATPTGQKFSPHGDCAGGYAYTDLAHTSVEARYTAPTAICPHPERWHADDWDSAETEVTDLVAAFVRALRPDLVIETGTAWGQTAYQIGTILKGAHVGQLITYEVVPERVKVARKRCEGLPVEIRLEASLEADLNRAPYHMESTDDRYIGFAWFDSLLPLRVPEFRYFYRAMAQGCIVGFHDTVDGKLWADIEALETEGLLLPMRLPTPRGVVFAEVVK